MTYRPRHDAGWRARRGYGTKDSHLCYMSRFFGPRKFNKSVRPTEHNRYRSSNPLACCMADFLLADTPGVLLIGGEKAWSC